MFFVRKESDGRHLILDGLNDPVGLVEKMPSGRWQTSFYGKDKSEIFGDYSEAVGYARSGGKGIWQQDPAANEDHDDD